MRHCLATVVIPTTGNRGALLRHSIQSVLNQTVQEFEICIVGDGVSDETKDEIESLKHSDQRIKFFDFPKHERRGEPYRHQVLQQSIGEFVFYLCDRDLMLPNHLEASLQFLQKYNFVSTTFIDVNRDQSLNINQYVSYFGSGSKLDATQRHVGSLSCISHSSKMYSQLDFGWRTTPSDTFTDTYMWRQFLDHPKCVPFSWAMPTVLYFKRGHHPGDPVEDRARELAIWAKRITNPETVQEIIWHAMAGLLLERKRLRRFRDQVGRLVEQTRPA
jgi:glycosyltransferase involved in cell wall biosynthesis